MNCPRIFWFEYQRSTFAGSAITVLAITGPTPGISRRRWQTGSLPPMASICVLNDSTCSSSCVHSSHIVASKARIRGDSCASAFSRISGICRRRLAGLLLKVTPRSRRKARIWLITAVRRDTSRSRTR